jgi:hypothetical protein
MSLHRYATFVGLALVLWSPLQETCAADETTPVAQSSPLEEKLASVEFRTQKLISAREKMMQGIAQLQPSLRKISCQAYPSRTNQETLDIIRKDLAELDRSSSQLSAEQLSRLSTQKQIASELKPGIDCSSL